LPGHIKTSRLDFEDTKHWERVAGDVYRKLEIKIKTTPAEPLNSDEWSKKTFLTYCQPQHDKDVVTSYADAAKALSALANLAREGNGKALWQLAEIVVDAVAGLNEIVTSNPNSIKPFAQTRTGWPLLRSTAPHLCDDDKLLNEIELGKSVGIQLDKFSKWKPDAAAQIAFELIKHIEFIRSENPLGMDAGKNIEFSKFLPPFSKDSVIHWWFIAEKFLLATYPEPEKIAELDALVTANSKRKYPSTRRAAILEKIRARFMHLATYPS